MSLFWLFLLCPLSYLLGSVSFSFIITKLLFRKDLAKQGSGNLGATNVFRNYGFKVAFPVLILDILKAAIPATVGLLLYGPSTHNWMHGFGTIDGQTALYSCGLAAFFGHCFPFWNKFKGGKGVATLVGVFLVANPLLTVPAFLLCLGVGHLLRCAALGSFFFITVAVLWQGFYVGGVVGIGMTTSIFLTFAYFAILFTHRANIGRLLRGTENKVSLFKEKKHIIEHEQRK